MNTIKNNINSVIPNKINLAIVRYRETKKKIAQRKNEGCLTVEMECSAFFAAARFRKVIFGQLLYGGDDVSGETHDWRDWNVKLKDRQRVFDLALEACSRL